MSGFRYEVDTSKQKDSNECFTTIVPVVHFFSHYKLNAPHAWYGDEACGQISHHHTFVERPILDASASELMAVHGGCEEMKARWMAIELDHRIQAWNRARANKLARWRAMVLKPSPSKAQTVHQAAGLDPSHSVQASSHSV